MKKSKYQDDISNLVDLVHPMTDYDKQVLLNVYGLVSAPKPKIRPPYDSLYLKQKASQGI